MQELSFDILSVGRNGQSPETQPLIPLRQKLIIFTYLFTYITILYIELWPRVSRHPCYVCSYYTYIHNWLIQPFSQDYGLAFHTTHVV